VAVEAVDAVVSLMRDVNAALEPVSRHVGYRVVREITEAVVADQRLGQRDLLSSLDRQVMQRVLTRLNGDEQLAGALENLRDRLRERLGDESASYRRAGRMARDAREYGVTGFWR
jgi:hypothetical protein